MSIKKSKDVDSRYDRLRRCLAQIGYACKGSMVRRFMPCGRLGCKCADGPRNWHGPYFDWSWKVSGKSRSVRLTSEQARLMSSYVRNDRKLRHVVAQMREISLKVIQTKLGNRIRQPKRLAARG